MLTKKILSKICSGYKKSINTQKSGLDFVKPESHDQKEKDRFKKQFYSQDGEDVVLAAFYEENPEYKGFYVDVGAFHPYKFSNTQYFYERGWHGINVDATPGSMVEFHRARPRDINVEVGIATNNDSLIYYCFKEPALNSFDKKLSMERASVGWKIKSKKRIKTVNINHLLEEYIPKGQTIDFINIDVEGLDFEVLKSLDWTSYKPNYILVEEIEMMGKSIVDYAKNDIYRFLRGKGYIVAAKTMRTIIFQLKTEGEN